METIIASTNVQRIARQIIDLGLSKALESMSFFMQQKISLQETDFKIKKAGEDAQKSYTDKKGDELYLLITEVIGELKGVSYLVFNEEEVEALSRVALPGDYTSNPSKYILMRDAVLLELDNVISASVITQVSNQLKYKIYGGVPQLKKVSKDEVNRLIHIGLFPDKYLIGFKTEFKTEKGDFSPEFLWVLDSEFIRGVDRFAADETNVEKLNALLKK